MNIINALVSDIPDILHISDCISSSDSFSGCSVPQLVEFILNKVLQREIKRSLALYDKISRFLYQEIGIFLFGNFVLCWHTSHSKVDKH